MFYHRQKRTGFSLKHMTSSKIKPFHLCQSALIVWLSRLHKKLNKCRHASFNRDFGIVTMNLQQGSFSRMISFVSKLVKVMQVIILHVSFYTSFYYIQDNITDSVIDLLMIAVISGRKISLARHIPSEHNISVHGNFACIMWGIRIFFMND